MDPLQVATLEGVCGRLDCRVEARKRDRPQRDRMERDRRDRAAATLAAGGLDPASTSWAAVPANPASEVPLERWRSTAFHRHLARVLDEVRRQPEDRQRPPSPDPDPPEEAAAVARACATCRGWCCRRGGTHAFVDQWSLIRILDEHPEVGLDELPRIYGAHLGETHLAGGCVFQGVEGCRLPRTLRSDTCNEWLCDDLRAARRRWREAEADPARMHFVAASPTADHPPGR